MYDPPELRDDVTVSPDDAMLEGTVPPSTPQSVDLDAPPSEDQPDDPDLGGPQVLDYDELPESIDFAKGG